MPKLKLKSEAWVNCSLCGTVAWGNTKSTLIYHVAEQHLLGHDRKQGAHVTIWEDQADGSPMRIWSAE